jgi:hypothetical protein
LLENSIASKKKIGQAYRKERTKAEDSIEAREGIKVHGMKSLASVIVT